MLLYVALASLTPLGGVSAPAGANRVVTVNALVLDQEGHAVAGLERGDFSLEDNGRQRSISVFRALRPPGKLLQTRMAGGYWISNRPNAAGGADRPVTVILLDTENTGPQYQRWSISQIARLAALLGPEEQIAVYQLRRDGLLLLHEFTGNREHLLAAIAPDALVHNAGTNTWSLDYQRILAIPASPPADRLTGEALEQLACQMGRYPGRKNLFWIASYFPRLFPDEKGSGAGESPTGIAAARALESSGVAVFPVDVRSPVPPVPFQPAPPITGTNMPALAESHRDFIRKMNAIAEATGGKAIVNRPELAEAIIDTMRATQRSYEVGFEVPADQWDGRYHRLRLQLRQHGLTAIYSHGYFAQTKAGCSQRTSWDAPEIGISVGISARAPKTSADGDLLLHVRPHGPTGSARRQWRVNVTEIDNGRMLAAATGNGPQIDLSIRIPESSRGLRVQVREQLSGGTGTITLPLDIITRTQIAPETAIPH